MVNEAPAQDAPENLMEDGCFEVPEAMNVSGLRHSVIYARMAAGDIPFVQLGRKRLIPKRGLWRFLAKNLAPGPRG